MGRENIEATSLRERFYNNWVKELELLQGNYDFKVEARKLIERALLSETIDRLPITGHDIMETFNIKPGPQVGTLLERALILYQDQPCSREFLLDKLCQEMET